MASESSLPKILIVDDEEAILETMTFTFMGEYEVFTTADPRRALDLLDENAPVAVLITDQRRPHMTGVELLEAVYAQHPETVRIMLTGFADSDATIQAINAGHAYAYISKPWEPEELKGVVRRAAELHALSLENRRLVLDLQHANSIMQAVMDKLEVGAIAVDREYLAYAGPHNYYTTSRCHDLHLMMHTCMLLGQFKSALDAAEEICENLTADVIDLKDKPFIRNTMEGYFAMKMHALVRFGKWREIAEAPMPENAELYCVSTSMHHYAKGVAYAAMKQFTAAESQKTCFYDSLQRISPTRKFFNNPALQTLGVGEKMLLGELEHHKGNHEVAFEHLREAVQRSDSLHYSEPWPWMHPPRHALGALLMEQGQHAEAEKVYREDLGLSDTVLRCAQHPNNVWALHGLVECLTNRGETEESGNFTTLLESAIAKADFTVTSSCCCREKVRDPAVL